MGYFSSLQNLTYFLDYPFLTSYLIEVVTQKITGIITLAFKVKAPWMLLIMQCCYQQGEKQSTTLLKPTITEQ